MIERVIIEQYKSIRNLDLTLGPVNVLVGANGAGKSNFISFFELTKKLIDGEIRPYSAQKLANNLLYRGTKHSKYLRGLIDIDDKAVFEFTLVPATDESLALRYSYVSRRLNTGNDKDKDYKTWGSSLSQLTFKELQEKFPEEYLISFQVYHFHDTSETSPIKQSGPLDDNRFLRPDGSNLAAVLYLLKEKYPKYFVRIESAVKSIAPFFEHFDLKPRQLNPNLIKLEWKEQDSDMYLDGHNLSDGTLRFIALATLLLHPSLPKTILIDEPELGLHPFAIHKLASLIKKASGRSQIILSTQSVELVNQFSPEDIITVDRADGQSAFQRHDTNSLQHWLEDYSLGDLWQKNIIGGQP